MLTAYQLEGLKSINIPVYAWGSSYRLKIRSTRTGRLTFVSNLTSSVKKAIAKEYKITIEKLEEALSHKVKTEVYELEKTDSTELHKYDHITETEFHNRLETIMRSQGKAFKLNVAIGYTVVDNRTGGEDFFHPNICNTAIADKPFVVHGRRDIPDVMKMVRSKAMESVPMFESSGCKLKSISSFWIYVYKLNASLGDDAEAMPDIIKNDKNIMNPKATRNKCVFHCIAYHNDTSVDYRRLAKPVKQAFQKYCTFKGLAYSTQLFKTFEPIDIMEFDILEDCFQINIDVYSIDPVTGGTKRIRDSEKEYDSTLNMLAHEKHAMYIRHIERFVGSYKCDKCCMIFQDNDTKRQHERNKCDKINIKSFPKHPTMYQPKENAMLSMLRKYGIRDVDHYMDHFIVYDFEAILMPTKVKRGEGTCFINKHIPVSVSICDSLTNEVKCFVNSDTKQLLRDMIDYIHSVSDQITQYNENKFYSLYKKIDDIDPNGIENSTETHKFYNLIKQTPVIGFNSGRYDLNLIRNELFGIIGKVTGVIKSAGYMAISTDRIKMLDISNYLPAGTSYSKYLETYLGKCKCEDKITCVCGLGKGLFCYEYITSFAKLEETVLPPKHAFDSKLKGTSISDNDYKRLEFIWNHYDMKILEDLLIWYNNLDVKPFVQAIQAQREFYKRYDLDIFQDGVSLPGLAEKVMYKICYSDLKKKPRKAAPEFKFLMSRFAGYKAQDVKANREFDMTIEHVDEVLHKQKYLCGLCYNQLTPETASVDRINNKLGHCNGNILISCVSCNVARKDMSLNLFRRNKLLEYNSDRLVFSIDEEYKDIYDKMKDNIAGGPSIIFKRYAKVNETTIRNGDKLCKKVIGYDANALYLWALGNDMPCGRLTTIDTYPTIVDDIVSDKLFGFLECDIETPEHLKDHFAEMCPIFKNIEIHPTEETIGTHMYKYNETRGKSRARKSRKLIGSYFGKKILLYAPLLKWYLDHGLVITHTYSFVKAARHKPFESFMNQISDARRSGDVDSSKKMVAEMMKLIGNSAFGRSGMDMTKHRKVQYESNLTSLGESNQRQMDKLTNHFTFYHKEELDGATEFIMKKRRIKQNNPIHLSIAIYQLAKLRMLQFYYDCIDKYFDRSDFEYLEMDTDSGYMAFSDIDPFKNIVKPEMREHFSKHQNEWFPRSDTKEHAMYDSRTPGLFKEEWRGSAMVSLSSKNYVCYQPDELHKVKISSKGVQKSRNASVLAPENFERIIREKLTLSGHNMGFRVCKESKSMITYSQHKTAMSYFYDKRRVLPDGIHTEPLDL